MTMRRVTGIIGFPTVPKFAGSTIGFVNSTLSASGHHVAAVIRAPKAGTLHSFEVRQGTNTNTPDNGLRFSFEDPDGSGNPDGVQDQYRDVTSGFGAGAWLAPPGPLTSDGTNGGTKRTVAAGDVVCCVVSFVSFVASDSVTISQVDLVSGAGLSGVAFCDVFAAAWTKNKNSLCLALKYDDGSYVPVSADWHPVKALNLTTFNSGSTPDERGLRFQLPFQAECVGAWAWLDIEAACDLVLYDSDGTTVLVAVSLSSAIRPSLNPEAAFVPFAPQTLLANTTYRLTVKPTTGSNVSLQDYDVDTSALLQASPGGTTWYYTHRTDAGAWTDTNTKRPWMGLALSGVDDASGATPAEYAATFVG